MRSNSLRQLWNKSDVFKKVFIFLFFGRSRRIDFYDSMINYLETGASLSESLDNLCVDAMATGQKQLIIFAVVKENIEQGMNLHEALALKPNKNSHSQGFFSGLLNLFKSKGAEEGKRNKSNLINIVPSSEQSLVESGERSDALIKSLANIKKQLEVITKLQMHVISRVAPTLFVACLAYGSIIFQTNAYLNVREYFADGRDVEFPPLIHYFFAFGEILTNHWLLIAISLFMVVVFISYSLPNYTGRARFFMHRKLPPWNVYRNLKASEFFLSFSALVNSGMKTSESLNMMLPYANSYMKMFISEMYKKVQRGKEERISFDSELFPIRTKLVLFSILKNEARSLAYGVEVLAEKQTKQAMKSVSKFAAIFASILFMTIVAFILWSMMVSFELQDIVAESFGD